jgi:hypothetical protein
MRYYRPTIKQPISTFVEAPLELMAAKVAQDQNLFDKGNAALDDQSKLLGNLVVHDYFKEEKDARVQQYQQELEKARDILLTTGDSRQAANQLYKVQKGLSQDKFLNDVQNISKSIWETEKKIRENEDPVSPWNMLYYDYADKYSKGWKNPDGSIAAFNPGRLYEKDLDLIGKQKEMMAGIAADGFKVGAPRFDEKLGLIIDETTGREHVSSTKIREIANEKAQDYMLSSEGIQGMRRNNKLYSKDGKPLTQEQHLKIFSDELYRAGINQKFLKKTEDVNTKEMSDGFLARLGYNPNQFRNQDALQVFNLEGVSKQFGKQFKTEPGIADEQDLKTGTNKNVTSTYYNDFSKLDQQSKAMLQSYLDTKGPEYKTLKNKIINGTASQEELKVVYKDLETNFIPKFNLKAKQNAVARVVSSVKVENQKYTGLAKDDATLSDFKDSGLLTKNTKVFDPSTGEFILLKDIPGTGKEKAFVNKEFGYTSPFYTLSGGDEEFASPKQLTVVQEDGTNKTYILPNIGDPEDIKIQGAIAKNAEAVYQPNILKPSHRSGYKIKFVPLNNDTPLEQKEIDAYEKAGIALPGNYEIYNSDGELVDFSINPEVATSKIEEYANENQD